MIYSMLVLFTCCWGSIISIQAGVGKLNGDLLQLSGIRYKVQSFSVRNFISIAYWKRLISGVKLFIVVPQAIGISLRNRIGDSAGEFLVILPLGVFIGTMGLILLTCSLFLLVSGLHFIVCSSIDTPLYLFDPWPAFYHCLLCIRRFLAKIHVHMPIYAGFGQKSCTYAYIRRFLAKSHIHMPIHAGF